MHENVGRIMSVVVIAIPGLIDFLIPESVIKKFIIPGFRYPIFLE